MNEREIPIAHDDQANNDQQNNDQELVDRLVDGELNDVQQRELLLRLESLPDGWRRCALSFIEAQTWGREFKQLKTAPGPKPAAHPARGTLDDSPMPVNGRSSLQRPPHAPAMKTWWRGPLGSLLGMAASFFLAFGLGLAWRNWDGVDRPGANSVAANAPTDSPSFSGAPGGAPESAVDRDDLHWATVSVPVKGPGGETEQFDVPVAAGPGIDAQWLWNQPPALPRDLVRELERRGHRVRQDRQLIPFELEDGRQVVVPVDQVDVRFMGQRVIP